MKSWLWWGAAMRGSHSRFWRRARRVMQRPRLEYLEDRLAPALALSLSTLTGTVGSAYSQQVTTTGGGLHDVYSYSLATAQGDPPNNGLPPGLSLSASGVLSGVPTAPGAYDIVVLVTDNTSGATGEEAFPLSISPLITLSPSLANVTENSPVSGELITASGPAGDNYTFTDSGNFPPGLTLVKSSATTAQLEGTCNQFGTFSFTVTATDGNGYSGVQPYQVSAIPVILLSPAPVANYETDGGTTIRLLNDLPTVAVVGQPYSQTISASSVDGIASLTYNTTGGGALPAGLKITTTSSTLTISGTPTAFTQESSPVHINVTVINANGNNTGADYALDVEPNNASPYVAIQATQGSTLYNDLPAGVVGQTYPSTTFTTPSGSGTYTFSLIAPNFPTTNGGVPPGMTFNATTATLSGTPTQLGQYSLVIEATGATNGITDGRVFHLTITPPASGLQLGPATLPLGSPDVAYSQQITATGGTGTITLTHSFADGTLAELTALGLSITQPQSNILTISGTPSECSFNLLVITVTATDSAGDKATVQYPISVYYTPQQISEAYGLNMITLSGGISGTGAGQTVAIITRGDAANIVSTNDPNFANSDLHQFDLAFGLPDPPSFAKLNEFGGTDLPSPLTGDQIETTQDVEWVHALAPQANIVLLETGNSADGGIGLFSAIQTARMLPGVSVVSMSYYPFYDMNSSNSYNFVEPSIDSLFTSPPGHPMTFVVAAGDTYAGTANGEYLNHYPAVSPNVLAAGYTSLTLNAQGGIAAQPAVAGASGGASVQELQPSYQEGVVSQVSTTMRTVPDVTFNGYGAGDSAVAVYNSLYQGVGLPWTNGSGTSISTPSWAALLAIIDQGEVLVGKSPLDGPTQTLPDLYALAGTSAFDPVTTVTNGTVISPAFGSYNPYGGLGSPVANILVADLVPLPTPTFSGLSAPTIVAGTATTTLSGQIAAGTLIPSGSVAITLNGVTLNPTIDTTTGAFSAVFTTSALNVAGSPYTISYSFAGNAGFAPVSTTTMLMVLPATLVSISVTPAIPSIAAGLTEQFTATGTYTDGSTQNLTSQVTWSSSNLNVATISTSGLASAMAVGTTGITATLGTVASPSDTLTVTAAVAAVSVSWGTAGTASLQTAADGVRLLPAGRNTDLPWLGINTISITLSAPASLTPGDVTVTGITVANYGPVTISGSGINYTIMLAQPINVADRVTFTIGNAGIATFTRRLDVLPGDVNDDGIVTSADVVDATYDETIGYVVFADLLGDGVVDVADAKAIRLRNGTTLPPLG